MESVTDITEIVESPKSEQFNRKFRKFQEKSEMERKFGEEISENGVLLVTGNFRKFKPS